jgi:ATP-binding cassette subfamily B (MDR/TAP) protein 1
MAAGGLCAIASGAAMPSMTIIFGGMQDVFQDYFYEETSYEEFEDRITEYVLYFVYLGVGQFVASYISTVAYIYVGEHITSKIRRRYLESCLRQNIGFFDKMGAGEVTTRLTADMTLIQAGISEKVSMTLAALSTFITAFVIGFVHSWKLTLILSCTVVAWVIHTAVCANFMVGNMQMSLAAYAQGGGMAHEVLSSVRNVVAFGTQDRLASRYQVHLGTAEMYGFRFKSAVGMILSGLQLIMFLGYGLAFWQGSKFLTNGEIDLRELLIVLMSVMAGAFVLGNVAPNMQAFTTAIAASSKIFGIIDRPSPIDAENDDFGERPTEATIGNLRLENVHHIYPSRPDVVVMKDISLDIPAGKTTAIVGPSGSGKSTIVGLIERFYDPTGGKIYLDGRDISTLNVSWLRQQMALVGQEPVLFSASIYDNIAHGLLGSKFEHESNESKRERIYEAAKQANAHTFIMDLDDGYDTDVGQRGFLLSGGQKQRIAIARAIVSDPKILLLDEATSALDSKSEGIVQEALNVAARGRTTISIAHRLYTIKDADNIVVMTDGAIVEQGKHEELLINKDSVYAGLVEAQNLAHEVQAGSASPDEQVANKIEATKSGVSEKAIDKTNTHHVQSALGPANASGQNGAVIAQQVSGPKQYSLWTLIKFIVRFNATDWKLMVLGSFFSLICGLGNPTTAVLFAFQVDILSRPMPQYDPGEVKSDSDFWSAMYVMLAFVLCLAYAVQGIAFAKTSERLIHKVRDAAFRTLLRQDIEFFDRKENSTGALMSLLSTETTHVAGLSGVTLGSLIVAVVTLVSCCALGLAIGWKLTLVCMATLPITITCGFLQFWSVTYFQQRAATAYMASTAYASEAISSIRTVASLRRERDLLSTYQTSLKSQQRRSLVAILKTSSLFAASQSLLFFCLALAFWYGSTLLGRREYDIFKFFLCFMAILFGAQNVTLIFSFAPDMGKAHSAAKALKALFDQVPKIDTWAAATEKKEAVALVSGEIEFRDVHFRYPTRPDQPVLQGLSFSIKPGQYVALVGASGCGKSTALALLERFYDPDQGRILIDGKDISSLDINSYRFHLALVSQEPTLYQGTIRDNILLGTPSEDVSNEVIEEAARQANLLDFIKSLPEGFNTVVGNRGSLLSGGQKQRVAIAHALIRDPRILLLDEATSALDTESEHVVQAALDNAAKGRTTIAIAHRLSTIQRADVIYFFDKGRIVESGTHTELMRRQGLYAELVKLQTLES